jgi:hypothetical protein
LSILFYLAAYTAPATATWVAIGMLLQPLSERPRALASLAALYALRYGLAETLDFPLQPPGLRWQVPARWIKGQPLALRVLTWGALLGPGLVTRNPYAGLWLVPFLVGLNGHLVVAGLVGAAHGGARALGVLHNHRRVCDMADVTTWQALWHWRLWDGALLLIGAGGLVGHGLWTLTTR